MGLKDNFLHPRRLLEIWTRSKFIILFISLSGVVILEPVDLMHPLVQDSHDVGVAIGESSPVNEA